MRTTLTFSVLRSNFKTVSCEVCFYNSYLMLWYWRNNLKIHHPTFGNRVNVDFSLFILFIHLLHIYLIFNKHLSHTHAAMSSKCCTTIPSNWARSLLKESCCRISLLSRRNGLLLCGIMGWVSVFNCLVSKYVFYNTVDTSLWNFVWKGNRFEDCCSCLLNMDVCLLITFNCWVFNEFESFGRLIRNRLMIWSWKLKPEQDFDLKMLHLQFYSWIDASPFVNLFTS